MHILCFNETWINNMEVECIVKLVNHKFFILPRYNGHGTIILYDKNNTLYAHKTHTKNGIEIIVATFYFNIRRPIHVVAIFKPAITHIENFLQLLKSIYVKAPHHCPIISIGDFNVDMLENTSSSKKLKDYMQCNINIL